MTNSVDVRLDLGKVSLLFRCNVADSIMRTREFQKPEFGDDYVFVVADIFLVSSDGNPIALFQADEIGSTNLLLNDLADKIMCSPKVELHGTELQAGGLGLLHEKLFTRYVDEVCTIDENRMIDELAECFVASGDDAWVSVYELDGGAFIEVAYRTNRSGLELSAVFQRIDFATTFERAVQDVKRELADLVLKRH